MDAQVPDFLVVSIVSVFTGQCDHCGKEFSYERTRMQGRPRKYCSPECGWRHQYRSRNPLPDRRCPTCGLTFTPAERRMKYCSPTCRYRAGTIKTRVERRKCRECGTDLGPKTDLAPGPRWCDACRSERERAKNRRKNSKRRGAKTIGVRYTLNEIGERDGWKCHLCHRGVDYRLPGTADRGPTIDHLVPVSAGGSDEPSNVAVAHRDCNIARGAIGAAQLRLTG